MSQPSQNYISLSYFKKATVSEVEKQMNEYSWRIVFNTGQGCFHCQNISTKKVTRVKNVEDFIDVWIDLMRSEMDNLYRAEISLFVQDVYYSGYTCLYNSEIIPKDTAFKFSSILKNIL